MTDLEPTEQDAASLVQRRLGKDPVTVTRFTTGFANYVFEVRDSAHSAIVVRLNRVGRGENFAGAAYWHRWLTPCDVPLPRLLCYDASPADGSFPFMITTRVPGRDLDAVYPDLEVHQRRALATDLAEIQARVGQLPLGAGFGYARSYTDPSLHPTWVAFLRAELAWSRDNIERAGLVDVVWADRVVERLAAYQSYFACVEPRCFLDDIALKNVLVNDGRLSGIVDVDWVCFGDALLPLALTQARLLQRGWDADYVAYWVAALDLDEETMRVLTFYTAMWVINSLGLIGRQFGNRVRIPADREQVAALVGLLDSLLLRF